MRDILSTAESISHVNVRQSDGVINQHQTPETESKKSFIFYVYIDQQHVYAKL